MRGFKQFFALMLALVMMLSLTACGSKEKKAYEEAMKLYEDGEYEDARDKFEELGDYEDSEDMVEACEIKADPLKAVADYIKENGEEKDTGKYHLERDTDSEDLTMAFNYNEESKILTVVATSEKPDTVTLTYMTAIDVTGDKPGAIVVANTAKAGTTSAYSIASGHLDLENLKSDTRPEFEDFYSNLDNASANESYVDLAVDGINCVMEELANLLKDIHPDLTLKDLGIDSFKIDNDRESTYRGTD